MPTAWQRAALQQLRIPSDDLFAEPTLKRIDNLFIDQNLTLPPGRTWRQMSANVFSVVNGKKILFENPDGLFHQLRGAEPPLSLIREQVALSMTTDELHEDVHEFIAKLTAMTGVA